MLGIRILKWTYSTFVDNNVLWVAQLQEKHPNFFSKLFKQQTPKYLWIGCSDSRVSANEIINLQPGEGFESFRMCENL
ncbi:carbonic anhydrase [Bathymodiolus septemdierum thioautotrophic gill symbiont]|uniref:carbonic anhydrase n=1 Tax=Bathymodiolus septemdierum thioautotrophic gill symbiont TaxID=113267 RepID=UPI00082482E8